jgi:GNAT superfamily N-acetyltransferase
MLRSMEFGVEAAQEAWARLLGLSRLEGSQVVVDPDSWLAPRGWIGILAIGTTITVSVPRPDLEARVHGALQGLTADGATTPEIVTPRMPPTRASLGPAALFYPPSRFAVSSREHDEASSAELADLLAAASVDDLDESGIAHVDGPTFVSRASDGRVAAASGYRRWPNAVAHLSVLTHPAHRRQGHGRRASSLAVQHAIADALLPQWRARPIASQELARTLGLLAVGAQFSLQPA